MKVTPGITLENLTGPVSKADLDKLGKPTVQIEDSDIQQVVEEVEEALGSGAAGVNYLRNADWSLWTRGVGPLSLPEGVWMELADHWFARAAYTPATPGGVSVFASYARQNDTVHQAWLYAAKLQGCTDLATMDVGQPIPSRVAAALHPKCTLTLEVENQTGAAIVPTLRIETCNTRDDFAATTLRYSQQLASIPNAERATYIVTLDLSGYGSQLRNGARIYVRFPGLGSPSSFVTIYAAKLETGTSATSRVTERDTETADAEAADASAAPVNYVPNGQFHRWLTPSRTCAEDVPNFGPVGWYARPADGTGLTLARDTVTGSNLSRYSAKLVGAVDCTGVVDFGAQIPELTAAEARMQLVFSCAIWNDTGATRTPELRIDTCDGENTFGAVTNRVSQALQACANGAWTTVSYAINAAAVTNWANGVEIYLRFAAGALAVGTQVIRIARPRLEPGTAASDFVPAPSHDEPAVATGAYTSLRVAYVDATHLSATAEDLVLKDAGGNAIVIPTLSGATLNLATVGAGGRDYAGSVTGSATHFLWAISRGDSHALLLSATATPTLPSGYLYRALIGAFVTTSGSEIPHFFQHGKEVWLRRVLVLSAVAAGANAWQTLSVAACVPANACAVSGVAGASNGFDTRMRIAGDNPATWTDPALGEATLILQDSGSDTYNFECSGMFRVPIQTAQTIYWGVNSIAPTHRIEIAGYTLP